MLTLLQFSHGVPLAYSNSHKNSRGSNRNVQVGFLSESSPRQGSVIGKSRARKRDYTTTTERSNYRGDDYLFW